MNQYKIYFEFYGRKMQTTLYADSKDKAMDKVRKKIEFIKVEKISDPAVEKLMNFLGMK